MAGSISYEYLNAQINKANGLAGLNGSSKVEVTYLPTGVSSGTGLATTTDGKVPVAQLPTDVATGTGLATTTDGKVPVAQLPTDVSTGTGLAKTTDGKVPVAELPTGVSSGTGLATTVDGKIPEAQLPTTIVSNFKGTFATSDLLPSTGNNQGDYAWVASNGSGIPGTYWYYNSLYELSSGGGVTAKWVNVEITKTDYDLLTPAAQKAVIYSIVPTP